MAVDSGGSQPEIEAEVTRLLRGAAFAAADLDWSFTARTVIDAGITRAGMAAAGITDAGITDAGMTGAGITRTRTPGGRAASASRDHHRRRRRRRVRVVSVALVVASVLAILAVPVVRSHLAATTGAQPAGGLVDTAATPAGWAPVAYGDAQISVPSSWFVEGDACGGGVAGMVFVGRVAGVKNLPCPQLTENVVSMTPIQGVPARYADEPPKTVNGVKVVTGPHGPIGGSYFAPALGVEVIASGPLAGRVLATLTRSPLAVVLSSGAPSAAPDGWRWIDFGGVRLAAPSGWARASQLLPCRDGIPANTVILELLTTAELSAPSCGGLYPDAGSNAPKPGLIVDTGRYATLGSTLGTHCLSLHGMRGCISANRSGGLLTLWVFPPGVPRPTVVDIGLSGTGAVSRAIFDSIQPG